MVLPSINTMQPVGELDRLEGLWCFLFAHCKKNIEVQLLISSFACLCAE